MDTKKLRQKILDLAIHGKLVPNEGPWEEKTLGEIGKWQAGSTPSRANKSYYGGDIPWLKTGDLNDGYIDEIPEYITEKALNETSVKLNPAGSVLIAMYGATIGKIGILTFPATTNQACCACVNPLMDNKYLFYFLLAKRSYFIALGGGGAQPNISKDKIVKTPILLPPLSEQKRIVAEVEKWFALIDVIENSQQELNTAIDQAKNKILDLAIHGKLVPNEGPWEEVSMQSQVDIISGVSYNKADVVLGSGIRILRGGNIQSGNIEFYEDDVFVGFQYKNENNTIKKGDIALVASTGSALLIGKTGFAKESMENTQIGAFLRIIRCKNHEQSNYINLVFNSSLFKNHIQSLAKGTNINNIKANYINDFVFPLPPLSEQKRIVEKIEQLFAALDAMKM